MLKNKFKSRRTLQLILSFLILHSAFYICTATIRYVSHSGSSTPPYTTWETAADSIMSAINISVFGDAIYVANGVYEEQVIMIPGLTLIGSGMDSTIIDTRLLAFGGFNSVTLRDSCVIKGFQIIVANQDVGNGIKGEGQYGLITLNKIKDGVNGIYLFQSDIKVENNICENNRRGIRVSHSSSIVRNNNIYSDYFQDIGIILVDFNITSTPIIDSNIITTNSFGIKVSFGTNPTIKNNIIYLIDDFARGYSGSLSDTVKIYNNLVIAEDNIDYAIGIGNSNVPSLTISNYVYGYLESGISVGSENIAKNNVVEGAELGYFLGDNYILKYNNAWNNNTNYSSENIDSTNLSVDPMVVSADSLDFHLQKYSPLIDSGDPDILDVDGSRSDIGLYGGPFGERYEYLDLAPKPPRNLSAVVDSEYITVSWNSNTEADFKSYSLYRDTTANFTADSTTFVLPLADTFYTHLIPGGIDAFYYKLTANDNQGNESSPSEELAVIITSINEYPASVSNYQLYQNYPNPFNPSTKIAYKLKERGYVKLYVYDIKGELVAVLVNETQDAGYYEVEFNAGVGTGLRPVLASGIYIYQIMIKSENNPSKPGPNGIPVFTDMKKMLMIK